MTKKSLKQRLYTYETNIAAIITNGLVHSVPKQVILKRIKVETARISSFLALSRLETQYLWLNSNKIYNKTSKRLFSELRKIDSKQKEAGYHKTLPERRNETYRAIRDEFIYNDEIEKNKNLVANSVEHRIKHSAVFGPDGIVAEVRANVDTYSPFFLASAHANPAKDHADWEGKMYYDEDWERYVTDADAASSIRAYIKNHKLHSIQWVSGPEGKIYLTTRPNCKHYFINILIDEVLNSSTKKILKKHQMYMPDELPETYEHQQFRKYYERLKVLKKLSKLTVSEQLNHDIIETRRLMRRWASRARSGSK